ncbi:MAG: MBL fold metallo-hydrolase [Cyclobacteriaceae bacterium]|nr:MBL fold metallo-hydrolase [Cyclobacteriaceae bacterium]MDH5249586.1 MBL fold metallo-hydrolase [Cyclobacteriaceae bacterium]
MVSDEKLDVLFFASGYCVAQSRIVNPGGGWGWRRFYAVWVLIKHPVMGVILFDGGYNLSFNIATKAWPDRLYRWVTPVVVTDSDSAVSILKREGISPVDVKYFVISHFHADHICALNDFPNAELICSKKGYEEVARLDGFAAVRKGILKRLIPVDFEKRVLFLEDISITHIDNDSQLTFFVPFGQDLLQFVDLPGHARGMFGFYVKTSDGEILYGTDASWESDMFLNGILPSPVVRLFIDSWPEYMETNRKLLLFLRNNPGTQILFTHCSRTLKYVRFPVENRII